MALTDAGIRNLETPAKRMQMADGGGLSLDLHPSGKKSWLYRYRLNGEYGRVTLGRYPDLSLKAARKKRDELAGQVATGQDPARRKRRDRLGYSLDSTVEEFGDRSFVYSRVHAYVVKPRESQRALNSASESLQL